MRPAISELAARHGLELVGVADVSMPDDRHHAWRPVAAGRMARMGWMGATGRRSRPIRPPSTRRRAPSSWWPPRPPAQTARRGTRTPARSRALASVLSGTSGGTVRAIRATRSAPTITSRSGIGSRRSPLTCERPGCPPRGGRLRGRPAARRARWRLGAGLGWIGKNTNLLTHHRAGSWVFLGAILTSAELEADVPVRSSCGGCAMPVRLPDRRARVARTIDAGRCISCLTIERPGVLEPWEASAIGDWIFGCDVCQEVCPVNAGADDSGPLRVPLLPLIDWLLPLGSAPSTGPSGHPRCVGRAGIGCCATRSPPSATGLASAGAVKLLERAAADRRPEVRTQALRVLDARAQESSYRSPRDRLHRCPEPPPSRASTMPSTASAPMPCRAGPPPRTTPSSTAGDRRSHRPRLPAVRRHQRRGAHELLARNDRNAVRLEYSAEPDPHASARPRWPPGWPTGRSSAAPSRARTTTATGRRWRR